MLPDVNEEEEARCLRWMRSMKSITDKKDFFLYHSGYSRFFLLHHLLLLLLLHSNINKEVKKWWWWIMPRTTGRRLEEEEHNAKCETRGWHFFSSCLIWTIPIQIFPIFLDCAPSLIASYSCHWLPSEIVRPLNIYIPNLHIQFNQH